jgi:hypothetical protein
MFRRRTATGASDCRMNRQLSTSRILDAYHNKRWRAADQPRPPGPDPDTTDPIVPKDRLHRTFKLSWLIQSNRNLHDDGPIHLSARATGATFKRHRWNGSSCRNRRAKRKITEHQDLQAASLSGSTFLSTRGESIQPASQPASQRIRLYNHTGIHSMTAGTECTSRAWDSTRLDQSSQIR